MPVFGTGVNPFFAILFWWKALIEVGKVSIIFIYIECFMWDIICYVWVYVILAGDNSRYAVLAGLF